MSAYVRARLEFYLFIVIKGRMPLTHHTSSITITTKNAQALKMNKFTMLFTKPHKTLISCK